MKTLHSVSRVLEYVIFGVWSKMKMQYLTYGQKWKCEQSTTPGHWPHRNIDQIGTPTMRPEGPLVYIYFYILSVRLSVCVVDHTLTAVPIDFIFCMHIDVIPRSDIGISFFHFCSLKIIYGQYSALGACNICATENAFIWFFSIKILSYIKNIYIY